MDILFINPDSSSKAYQGLAQLYSAIEPTTWSLLLAESCRLKHFDVGILDCDAERLTIEQSILWIQNAKPPLLGFSWSKARKCKGNNFLGTGSPRREFIHADDIAEASIWLLETQQENLDLPINIGVGIDYSVKELAEKVAQVIGYQGRINWDSSKPDGAPKKLDITYHEY